MEPTRESEHELQPLGDLPTAPEERKKALRARCSLRPLSPEESRRQDDILWARQEPEVLEKYRGEFVVPVDRRIVAHGRDAAAVLAEAARVTRRKVEELALVGIIDPLQDTPR